MLTGKQLIIGIADMVKENERLKIANEKLRQELDDHLHGDDPQATVDSIMAGIKSNGNGSYHHEQYSPPAQPEISDFDDEYDEANPQLKIDPEFVAKIDLLKQSANTKTRAFANGVMDHAQQYGSISKLQRDSVMRTKVFKKKP